MSYEKRTYRCFTGGDGLVSFDVMLAQSDLFISADRDLSEKAMISLARHRRQLEAAIEECPEFISSLLPINTRKLLPTIATSMLHAAAITGVGPMAGVAGAIADFVGRDLLELSTNVIIENGGDLFVKVARPIKIGIFAGDSPLSNRISLQVDPEKTPRGVCTSSGTVGNSLSMGNADAVCVVAASATLADCAATAIGNVVVSRADIKKGLSLAQEINGVVGCLIIVAEAMGCWGDVKLV